MKLASLILLMIADVLPFDVMSAMQTRNACRSNHSDRFDEKRHRAEAREPAHDRQRGPRIATRIASLTAAPHPPAAR